MSIISNNRFLMKTNPQITRALADSGSSLNHPEIQRLARQQVDLGIWSNLKLWVHRDLVKTRTSGSDLFVPKAYDISGNEDDAVQATEANQAKLVSTGMQFDGSNDYLSTPLYILKNHFSTTPLAIMTWLYIPSYSINNTLLVGLVELNLGYSYRGIGLGWRCVDGVFQIYMYYRPVYDYSKACNFSISTNTWYLVTGIINPVDLTIKLYLNTNVSSTSYTYHQSYMDDYIAIAQNHSFGGAGLNAYFKGILNDIRIYYGNLTVDQITAIYNLTKSYYGL